MFNKKAKLLGVTAIVIASMGSTVLAQNIVLNTALEEETAEAETEVEYENNNPVDPDFVGAYSKREVVEEDDSQVAETETAAGEVASETEETENPAGMSKKEVKAFYKKLLKKCSKKNAAEQDSECLIVETNEPIYNLPDVTYTPYISGEIVAQKDPTYTQEEFIEKIGTIAVEYWDEYQLLPSVTIAQAIIESRWGASSLGSKYHNYFGIKYSSDCGCDYVVLQTSEQEKNGTYYKIQAKFRAYPTMQAGIEDRYKFLTAYARYENLIGVTDYKTACRLLQADGYATSQTYAQTLINTIESYGLQEYDEIAINGGV